MRHSALIAREWAMFRQLAVPHNAWRIQKDAHSTGGAASIMLLNKRISMEDISEDTRCQILDDVQN